jgi:hypothetical protein
MRVMIVEDEINGSLETINEPLGRNYVRESGRQPGLGKIHYRTILIDPDFPSIRLSQCGVTFFFRRQVRLRGGGDGLHGSWGGQESGERLFLVEAASRAKQRWCAL